MSEIDNSSLFFMGSANAGKDGTVFSVKPDDGSGDFTVDRGCSFPATRVNSNGKIQKYPTNLLLQSNTLSTSPWVVSGATITAQTDGWELNNTSSLGYLSQNITTDGERRIYVKAKKGTNNYLIIAAVKTSGTAYASFDLENGVPTSSKTADVYGVTMTEEDDWRRCSMVVANDVTSIRFYSIKTDGVFSDAQGSIYVKDAMMSIGSGIYENLTVVTDTDPNDNDTPRYDFIDGCSTLLLEGASQNLIYDSNTFDYDWVNGDLTATPYAAESPEGQSNAVSLSVGTSNAKHFVAAKEVALTAADPFAFAVYAKYIDVRYIRLKITDVSHTEISGATFDMVNSTVEDLVGVTARFATTVNGYPRLVISGVTASSGNYRAAVYFLDDSKNETWTGSNQVGQLYEATLEVRTQPSSLIPRSGASIIRNRERITISDSILFGGEGYLYAEVMASEPETSSTFPSISISNGAIDNRVFFYYDSDGVLRPTIRLNNTEQMPAVYSNVGFDRFHKVLINYHHKNYFATVDGAVLGFNDDASAAEMIELQDFKSSSNSDTTSFFFQGRIKRMYFNRITEITRQKSIELTSNIDKVFAMIGPSSIFYGGLRDGDLGSEPNINNLASWSRLKTFPNFHIYNYGINATAFDDQIDLILDSSSQPKGPSDWNALRLTKDASFQSLTLPKAVGFYDTKPNVVLTSGGTIQRLTFIIGTSTPEQIAAVESIVKDNLRKLLDYNISQNILTIVQKTHNIGQYYSGSFVPSDVKASAEYVRTWQQSVVDEYTGSAAALISVIDMKDLLNDSDTSKSSAAGPNTNSGYTGQQYLQSDQQHWNEVGYGKIADAIYDILEVKVPNTLKTNTVYP